jgi:hypothetical protein
MKTALCYSGQIGGFSKAFNNQKQSFLDDCDDIYSYTSNLITHKGLSFGKFERTSDIHEYLKGGVGWRKNIGTYGVAYKVKNKLVKDQLLLIEDKLKKSIIEDESLEDTLQDSNLSKWEWLKKRQLWKMYSCNNLIDSDYDIIVRCRFEFCPYLKIPIKEIYKNYENENKIFVFGGWNCVPPMVFMDEFFCDGFAFGSPKVMNVFTSLYLQKDAYPFNPKYKECWDKYGDNVEYQLKKHLEKHDIELVYIGNQRSMYHLQR